MKLKNYWRMFTKTLINKWQSQYVEADTYGQHLNEIEKLSKNVLRNTNK